MINTHSSWSITTTFALYNASFVKNFHPVSNYIPRVKLFVIFRQRACEIVDVYVDTGSVTIADAGTDVGPAYIEKVRTKSSDGVLANIRDALVNGSTKQKSADQLVTDEDGARN